MAKKKAAVRTRDSLLPFSFATVDSELNDGYSKKMFKHKKDDLYHKSSGCSIPLLPQVDEV